MSRAARLARLADLRRRDRDRAAGNLQQARQDQALRSQTLEDLERYRQEYAALLDSRARDGLPVNELANFQRFFDTLDKALQEQRRALGQSEQVVRARLDDWQSQQQRVDVMDRASEGAAQDEDQQARKREEQRLAETLTRPTGSVPGGGASGR